MRADVLCALFGKANWPGQLHPRKSADLQAAANAFERAAELTQPTNQKWHEALLANKEVCVRDAMNAPHVAAWHGFAAHGLRGSGHGLRGSGYGLRGSGHGLWPIKFTAAARGAGDGRHAGGGGSGGGGGTGASGSSAEDEGEDNLVRPFDSDETRSPAPRRGM